MAKVLLKDVVMRVKDKVDKDCTSLEYYIGGEHIQSNEICITQKGTIAGSTIGPAFHMGFKAGDVLLMSRNPHLRKASMVDFDGICSDVSYVCRTKDESILLQSFLPFVMQTDDFWRFAEENKKGGLPFFLNWSDFEKYEFQLPPIEKQKELSNILWSMQNTKSAYEKLLRQTDELVKSQFIEVITPMLKAGETVPLIDLIVEGRPITYGILKPGTNVVGGIPVVKVKDMVGGTIDESDLLHTTPEIDSGYKRSKLNEGDLLISIRGSVGRTAIVTASLQDANITQDTARLSIKPDYSTIYVRGVLESQPMQLDMEHNIRGVAVKGINIGYLRQLGIPVADRAIQERLEELYKQSDKSKFELKKSIENITNLMKSLMQQDFS